MILNLSTLLYILYLLFQEGLKDTASPPLSPCKETHSLKIDIDIQIIYEQLKVVRRVKKY